MSPFNLNRREMLRSAAAGFGWLAFNGLYAANAASQNPLAPRAAAFHRAGEARDLSFHVRRAVAGGFLRSTSRSSRGSTM